MTAEDQYVKPPSEFPARTFGAAVAIDGNTLAISAPTEEVAAGPGTFHRHGAVYVFVRDDGDWVFQARIVPPYPQDSDRMGRALALQGDTLVVGVPEEDSSSSTDPANNSASNAGAVLVYRRSGNNWLQQAYLKASNVGAGDEFGSSVSLHGNTLVVGAPLEAGNGTSQADNSRPGSGAAYVFVRSGETWSQQAYLKAGNVDAGDNFGRWVAVDGNTVAVGAPWESGNGINPDDNSANASGAAYVFSRSGVTWTQQAYLKAAVVGPNDLMGEALALEGQTLAVSARTEDSDGSGPGNNSLSASGAVLVFERTGVNWHQSAFLKAENPGEGDWFGYRMALRSNVLAITAVQERGNGIDPGDNSAINAGAAYIFHRTFDGWEQVQYLKASNAQAHDRLGAGIALGSRAAVVGAVGERSATQDPGDNSVFERGAAYAYDLDLMPDPVFSASFE